MITIEDKVRESAKIMCDEYYFKHYKKYRPIGFRNFEKKYFCYFERASESFCVRAEFKPKDFINSVLAEGFIYPQQLSQEKNYKIYLRNKAEFAEKLLDESDEKKLVKRVVNIFVFLNNRKIEQITKSVILSNDFIAAYADDNLDLCVYCFSKAFKEFAEKERMMIDFAREQRNIKRYKRVFNKIKEKLGDDFFEAN